jgi:hypothetical protein
MKLSGNPGPLDTYVVTAFGSNPAPGVSDVAAAPAGDNQASVGWRITSDEPATLVSIYANPGVITTTQVITAGNGTTQTQVVPSYTGELLATNVMSPLDGRQFTTTVSLNQLTSGAYHIWVEADDGANPPVRVYAPDPIQVAQGGSWAAAWTASVVVTPTYRALTFDWAPHPHPDVDGYRVRFGQSPISLTQVITTGGSTEWTAQSLDPGRDYYLAIDAYDEGTGRSSLSQVVSGAAGVAPFALSVPPAIPGIIGGQQATVVVTVTAGADPYPDAVGLLQARPADGLTILPPARPVTPTTGGISVPVTISTTRGLAGGDYTVPLQAQGGGVTRTASLNLHILQPGFDLALAPAAQALGRGQSVQVAVSTTAIWGDDRLVTLQLGNAPAGLQWRWSDSTLAPSESATLALTDTVLLDAGAYQLLVSGSNGTQTVERTLSLSVQKAAFAVTASPAPFIMQPAQMRLMRLDVQGLAGWTGPVTLTLDAATVPAEAAIGFATGGGVAGQVVVAAPGQATLRVAATPALPNQTYRVRVTAVSGGYQQIFWLELNVQPAASTIYLPMIVSLWPAAP